MSSTVGEPANGDRPTKASLSRRKRIVYNTIGGALTFIGLVGIVTPVLPTTGFLILACGFFIRSNPSMYRWLNKNKITGAYLRVYTQGEGLSRKSKFWSIVFLWTTLLISAWFVRHVPWVLAILAAVGIGVGLHIATIKPRARMSEENRALHNTIMSDDDI